MNELLNITCEKYKLSNGLEIILSEDHSVPIVALNIWYKVGSANEEKNKTGLAHLFEHMMFQGSQNVDKGMHFKLIQEAGGTLNGSTSFDRTNYYEKVPSNFLELILWLEADRMENLLNALDEVKLKNQIDVVKNERLERYENQPYGLAWEKLLSNLFPENHPYHWPTIGWMDDILNYKLDDVKSFFQKYYQPANASLTLVGDFEIIKAKELIEKYFSTIKSTNQISDLKIFDQVSLEENKKIIHFDNVQLERIYLAWHSDKYFSNDDASLDLLSHILSGSKNSRLQKNLIFEKELVQNINAFNISAKYGGFFVITATAKPNISLDKIQDEIFYEINKLLNEGISLEELDRAKNVVKSSFIYSIQSLDILADQFNNYNFYLGQPDSFNYDLLRYQEVSLEKIMSVIKNYFSKNYVELRIVPKKNEPTII